MKQEYTELRANLAIMSDTVAKMVQDSIKSLVDNDIELAKKVIETDNIVDELDIKIDEQCVKIIAKYEPKATDLRYVITALRIIVDLERIGDHARNISKQAVKLSTLPKVKEYIDLPKMAEVTSSMVKTSVEAYFNRDEEKAMIVIRGDSDVDSYQNQITRELITYIIEDPSKAKVIIKLINITRRLERIADHAKNIAELVSFMVTGKILRHTKFEEESE